MLAQFLNKLHILVQGPKYFFEIPLEKLLDTPNDQ